MPWSQRILCRTATLLAVRDLTVLRTTSAAQLLICEETLQQILRKRFAATLHQSLPSVQALVWLEIMRSLSSKVERIQCSAVTSFAKCARRFHGDSHFVDLFLHDPDVPSLIVVSACECALRAEAIRAWCDLVRLNPSVHIDAGTIVRHLARHLRNRTLDGNHHHEAELLQVLASLDSQVLKIIPAELGPTYARALLCHMGKGMATSLRKGNPEKSTATRNVFPFEDDCGSSDPDSSIGDPFELDECEW